jgi:hypothetical protein
MWGGGLSKVVVSKNPVLAGGIELVLITRVVHLEQHSISDPLEVHHDRQSQVRAVAQEKWIIGPTPAADDHRVGSLATRKAHGPVGMQHREPKQECDKILKRAESEPPA